MKLRAVVMLIATSAIANIAVAQPDEPDRPDERDGSDRRDKGDRNRRDVDARIAKARQLIARGELGAARAELVAAFATEARPELLFALGQVELNLGHYAEAIRYYERFIATGPAEDQISLAQQAIGAARMRIVAPPQNAESSARVVGRPEPVYRRKWRLENTGLVALGGAMVVTSGILFGHAGRIGDDRSGSLADYDARLDQARGERWAGVAIGALGIAAGAIAIVRWRLDRTEVGVGTSAGGAGGAAITASTTW